MPEPIVTVKFSETEIDHITVAIHNMLVTRIPTLDEGWKKPYQKLHNDFCGVKRYIEKGKDTNGEKKETKKDIP